MRNECGRALRIYMSKRFRHARTSAGFTQAKFAERLLMDTRSYAALEGGESLCGTVTFVLYLVIFCKDADVFMDELRQVVLSACKESLGG